MPLFGLGCCIVKDRRELEGGDFQDTYCIPSEKQGREGGREALEIIDETELCRIK